MSRELPHNMIVAWRNAIARATLSGGTWSGRDNLKTWYLGQEAVSGTVGAGPHVLRADWSTEEAVDLIVIAGHNLVDDQSTIRVQLWSGATALYDSGAVDAYAGAPIGSIQWGDVRFWGHVLGPWGVFGLVLDEMQSITRMDVTITGAGQDGQALSVPILYAGPSWQVDANYDRGSATGRHSASEVQGADRGVPLPDLDPEPRTWSGALSNLTEGEISGPLPELLAHTGRGRLPFLLLPEPGTQFGIQSQTLLAFLADTPRVARSTTRAGLFTMEFEAREWLA